MRIRDSVAVVTGASAGIGRETAALLADRGARVWAVARSEGPLEELAGDHPNVVPFVADVSDDDDRSALVKAVGDVDILVNNAGMGWTGLVENTPPEEVRRLFETNVLALIDLTQRVLPGMLERRHGHVCNVASVASWVSTPPSPSGRSSATALPSSWGATAWPACPRRGRPGPWRGPFAWAARRGGGPSSCRGCSA